ncbi:MAG: 5-amino-6-(D-ribitylamino)uracil--L-tyrosine 4-hydroxyphenyl transferase CofH [Burkholderiaceae bacterium]|nr:5-amino-6-(D-ribitylamino)uracil--L-tyrosine 4-hydroxyphenyl transferase CofH [Burkholderiaceae bacterium]
MLQTRQPLWSAQKILATRHEDLLQAAESRARQAYGNVITYSRKVFAPLTRLCRDFCGYCTFSRPPRAITAPFMAPEEVVELARRGDQARCSEMLFTLGDKPELRFPSARDWLARRGYESTFQYLLESCREVGRASRLLTHVNAGVLSAREMAALREHSVSVGLMLESTAERLMGKGMPHYRSPDKHPEVRLRMLAEAGILAIPTTTGILIGIGETREERLDALASIGRLHERYGHIQEVIIQNFRAKDNTPMRAHPEPDHDDHLWTIAAARLLLDDSISVQAPPNLTGGELLDLAGAGINDLGGISPVTIDYVNPEAAWPQLEGLSRSLDDGGFTLVPRLPVYPRYVLEARTWISTGQLGRLTYWSDASGHARDEQWRPGDAGVAQPPLASAPTHARERACADVRGLVERARVGRRLAEHEVARLFESRGADYRHVVRAADELRRQAVGELLRYVVNRNINYTNVCSYRCSFCAFSKRTGGERVVDGPYNLPYEEVAQRAIEARDRGATEVCMQGGIHPRFDGNTYLGLLRAVKAAVPGIHVHAFSPLEVHHGAESLGLPVDEFLVALKANGLGSLPGTAAEILDDEVRAVICPDKLDTAQWLAVVESAHRAGIPTTATIMFGHVERPVHAARHLLAIRDLQERTGGFTEFVPLPFVPMNTPMFKRHASRNGPTWRETVLMHAVARLVLHPLITNIQASWVKLGPDGLGEMLEAGVNDLGGVLMNESISRAAGADWGQEMTVPRLEDLARRHGRPIAQRTTLYQPIDRAASPPPSPQAPHHLTTTELLEQ